MSLPVRLNRVLLGTLVALPLLLPVLPTKVLLDPCEIAQGPSRTVMDAARFGADIDPLPDLDTRVPLLELPGEVVASPVELQVLVPLESFVAYFAYESVCGQE
ncbi:unnamed protein product [Linum trigynum]|uniref:Uncharacterized protein n=1 Tax=Linum trigynum TaxID=586398 RepID=A0AAV2G9M3_9ROSI